MPILDIDNDFNLRDIGEDGGPVAILFPPDFVERARDMFAARAFKVGQPVAEDGAARRAVQGDDKGPLV